MNELIEQFLIEARELADQGVDDLLALEADPADRSRLDGAFRAFHTLKGAAGIIEFPAMGRALHAAEDRLAEVRADGGPVPPDLVAGGLWCLDQILAWLDEIQAAGEAPTGPAAEAVADAAVARFAAQAEPSAAAPPAPAQTRIRYTPDAEAFFRGEDPLALLATTPGLVSLGFKPRGDWPPRGEFDPFTSQLIIEAVSDASPDEVSTALASVRGQVQVSGVGGGELKGQDVLEDQLAVLAAGGADGLEGRLASVATVAANVLRHSGDDAGAAAVRAVAGDPARLAETIRRILAGDEPAPQPTPAPAQPGAEAAGRLLRVEIARVDALVRLAGELGVAKNALGHLSSLAQAEADPKTLAAGLREQHARLERLTAELQRAVLNLRVLPLRQLFQRFPRLVREMSATLGKPATLVTEGEATEADKAVVEALFEPLLHVVRNALDHGLEPREARRAAGKPEAGVIRLAAARQGEHVIVEVEDDGRGLDLARIRQVAAERGVASPAALAALGEAETLDLVFAPGFSTATAVTDLSGRGVGMDAVRAAIERLGGRVDLRSRAGQGTTVRFVLPFTVMMTRVMTVEVAGQAFGVPLDAVLETVRTPRDRILPIGSAQAVVLRGRTVPLFDLGQTLGIEPAPPSAEATIVVTAANGHWIGFEVDRLGVQMDVMLKPMDGLLAGMAGFAGATLMGDGRVLIVLDPQELAL